MSSIVRMLACARPQGAQRRRSQPAFIIIMIMKLVSVFCLALRNSHAPENKLGSQGRQMSTTEQARAGPSAQLSPTTCPGNSVSIPKPATNSAHTHTYLRVKQDACLYLVFNGSDSCVSQSHLHSSSKPQLAHNSPTLTFCQAASGESRRKSRRPVPNMPRRRLQSDSQTRPPRLSPHTS
jgi:hypothetical protein